jgi:hypothetical protein
VGIKEHTKEWFYYYYLFILAPGGGDDDYGDRTWTKICQILRQQKNQNQTENIFRIPNSAGATFVSFLDKWHVVGNPKHPPCQIWMMLPPFFGKLGYLLDHPVFFFSFPFLSAHMLTLE